MKTKLLGDAKAGNGETLTYWLIVTEGPCNELVGMDAYGELECTCGGWSANGTECAHKALIGGRS